VAPIAGRKLIDRVVRRVHAAAQCSATQEDYELGAITLRLLGLLRAGADATLDGAAVGAFGCSFDKWRARNLERQSVLAWELGACEIIPDYDEALDETGSVRRQAQSRGRGLVHQMPAAKVPRVKEPVCRPSEATAGTDAREKASGERQ
jgi:hypothetical protein